MDRGLLAVAASVMIAGYLAEGASAFAAVWPTIVRARLYGVFDSDPTHLTPAQVEEEIALTQAALASHFTQAAVLIQLGRVDPGFSSGPTKDELNSIMHVTDTERDPHLAEAIAITDGRLPSGSQLAIPTANGNPQGARVKGFVVMTNCVPDADLNRAEQHFSAEQMGLSVPDRPKSPTKVGTHYMLELIRDKAAKKWQYSMRFDLVTVELKDPMRQVGGFQLGNRL
jgi:hypothetical protein